MERQFLNEKQVSERYGWGLSTLRNWRFLGRGPAYSKVGKSVRYNLADLEDFMRRHRIDPEAHLEG
jgi:Helix-turn-helix domain